MGTARRREQWWHTAHLLAQQANIHRDHKRRTRPYAPAEFHPLIPHRPPAPLKTGIGALKVFLQ